MARRISVKVNRNVALKQVMTSNKGELARLLRKEVGPEIEKKQRELLSDFEKHPVTSEIKGGSSASPSSGVTGGYGNLFSFIGFENGSNPIASIRQLLDEKIQFNIRSLSANGLFKVEMKIPTLEEVFSVSPIPWAQGSSWAEGIEKGISNIGSYVYTSSGFSGSRSGSGLQSSNGAGTTFDTTPYMSKIIADFKKNLKKLN